MSKAIFAKPNIPQLKKKGYFCMDMHCHSCYSDGWQKIDEIYRKCRKMGIGIAITDHNEINGALKMSKYKDILTVPGIEVTSSEGIHTLFYFYNTKELEEFHKKVVKPNHSENPFSDIKMGAAEIMEKSRRYNCLISTSHPFAPGSTGIGNFMKEKKYRKLLKHISFIEAINSSTFHYMNKKAVEWGNKIKKNFTGGSDAHTMGSVGTVITGVKSENFLDALKKDSIVVGKEASFPLLAARTLLKLRMWGRFPRFYAKKIWREACKIRR